jgi:hypothetical protein
LTGLKGCSLTGPHRKVSKDCGEIVGPMIHYDPHHFQLFDSGCILNGVDVLCITRTGGGKSALILFPALARKEMINIVIEPTNVLENDMVRFVCIYETSYFF